MSDLKDPEVAEEYRRQEIENIKQRLRDLGCAMCADSIYADEELLCGPIVWTKGNMLAMDVHDLTADQIESIYDKSPGAQHYIAKGLTDRSIEEGWEILRVLMQDHIDPYDLDEDEGEYGED